MALAASAWVTTEQELKLAVVAAVVVVDAGALVVVAELDDVDDVDDLGEELHAAKTMVAGAATTIPTTPRCTHGCNLI
jgi:hypothetical protein